MASIPFVCFSPLHQHQLPRSTFSSNPPLSLAKHNLCCFRIHHIKESIHGHLPFIVSRSTPLPLRHPLRVRLRDGGHLLGILKVVTRRISRILENDSSQFLSRMFPFAVAATAVIALVRPATFTWVSQDLYAPALGGIMLSIGIGMSVRDFSIAFQRPLPISIGFFAQYVLKPLLAVFIANIFRIPSPLSEGFILMSCVSMAQLSSYASFLCKADTALSVLLTSSTTIASVLLTPLITGLLIGSVVPVDVIAMAKSILQVVLMPVTLGLVLNTYAKPIVTILQSVMPVVAMVCMSICIGSPLAINRDHILSTKGVQLILPVLVFHLAAFILGYWLCKIPLFRLEEEVCMTSSLCIGMQSSTLAGLLAMRFLGMPQALPSAFSVIAMAVMGLSLGSFWGRGFQIRNLPQLVGSTDLSQIKNFKD